MKTQLATLFLVFASHGASAAHTLRGTEPHSSIEQHRNAKSNKDGHNGDSGNDAYRVVNGKKGFRDYSFDVKPILWLVVDKNDDKTGKCINVIAQEALNNYDMDLAVVDKEPKDDRLASDDIVVVLPKKTNADTCENIWNDIESDEGFSNRKRNGLFDTGTQNIAVFDVNTQDKSCERDCSDDKKKCEKSADPNDPNALNKCKKDESSCKKDCEKDCKDDCDDNWPGIFNQQCKDNC
eukprot:CCRYP_008442-RA/>CCRYP_008442-RA protein AED:0.22 eAED:0.22 QI:377/1/1/1/1/1/6/280/236